MLYFENLSGVKEDEYFRDGITEDIITELSKIKGLKIFPRPTVLAYRDKSVTPHRSAASWVPHMCSAGSLRRAGNRLRITTQLMDARTDFPLWSERYDREMEDVFEVQDEIARKIAEALRITLSPQEQEAIATKPTENLQAYDLYLRGKSYARRDRQDQEFALQMFENAVALDPEFRARLRRHRQRLRPALLPARSRSDLAGSGARRRRRRRRRSPPICPRSSLGQAWVLYAAGNMTKPSRPFARPSHARRLRGRIFSLGRALFASGRYQEIVDMTDAALEAAAGDYNIYVPLMNAPARSARRALVQRPLLRRMQALEAHLARSARRRARAHAARDRLRARRPARRSQARDESRAGAPAQ